MNAKINIERIWKHMDRYGSVHRKRIKNEIQLNTKCTSKQRNGPPGVKWKPQIN